MDRRSLSLIASAARHFLAVCIIGTTAVGATTSSLHQPVQHDTESWDYLDEANHAPGTGSDSMGLGEAVDLFTGNLQVTHPSSPSLPIPGGLSMMLARTYNSKAVYLDSVCMVAPGCGTTEDFPIGRSWVGAGWTSHLGRIAIKSRWMSDSSDYTGRDYYYESPSGSRYRFAPSVPKASPMLRIAHKKDPGGASCGSVPDKLCQLDPEMCDEEMCDPEDPNIVDWFEVTFPDGTVMRLDEIEDIPTDKTSLDWIKNYDQAGYYATSITDIHGNSIEIDYWGSSNPEYPEAIQRIWSPQAPGVEITTDVCVADDVTSGRCPAEGLLKTAHADGFQGADITYEFHYEPQARNFGGQDFYMLAGVDLPQVDGTSVGSIQYRYGVGIDGLTALTDMQYLDRIEYPQGAVSAYDFDDWSGGGYTYYRRWARGVVKRRLFPDGIADPGNELDSPHANWLWSRDFHFQTSSCSFGDKSHVVSAYIREDPTGRKSESFFGGHPCGLEDQFDFGAPGAVEKETVYDSDGVTPIRSTEVAWDYQIDPTDGEKLQPIQMNSTTTFHDNTEECFENETQEDAQTTRSYRHRDEWSQWRFSELSGDLFQGQYWRREYTHYHSPIENPVIPAHTDKHIIGGFTYRYVEEGSQRWEENRAYDSVSGLLEEVRIKNEWTTPGTVLDAANPGTDVFPPNAADDDNDPWTSLQYYSDGHVQSSTVGGGDAYPDASDPPDITNTYQWSHGVLSAESPNALSYSTVDRTIDPSGLTERARDPNGLETVYDYDELGRIVSIDPPGAVEFSTRVVYPTSSPLNEVRTITSPGAETDYEPANDDQRFQVEYLDGLGRVVERRVAVPGQGLSISVTRYDRLGRVIFQSYPLTQAQYDGTWIQWGSNDEDDDGHVDFSVTVPADSGEPRGAVYFYGEPNQTDPDDPLQTTPEPLGRVTKVVLADGSVRTLKYCGPHVEQTVEGIQTGPGTTANAVTRQFFDGIGRLVLVDGPASGADAEYDYDLAGNLVRVNLVEQLPSSPFAAWKTDSIPEGQVRTFEYDAAGRLIESHEPETGSKVVGNRNQGAVESAYGPSGNVLIWRDALAVERGYYFQNDYDPAGRLVATKKVPEGGSVNRLGTHGDFEESSDFGTGAWIEGTISPDRSTFQSGDSLWRAVAYGGCTPAPQDQGGNLQGLYLGDACTYDSAPAGEQALRHLLEDVTREDTIDFKFWRQVREGTGDLDRLSIFVTQKVVGQEDDVTDRRYVYDLDQSQVSYAQWRRTHDIRLGDLFDPDEWPEAATRDLFLYIVFEKGDTQSSGLGTGVMVDDVFVGRKSEELIAEYSYDTNEVPAYDSACGNESDPNYVLGRLTGRVSYQSGRQVSRVQYSYRGLNGRLSTERQQVDWTGLGILDDMYATHYGHDGAGEITCWSSPYRLFHEENPTYEYQFRRGYLDGITTDSGTRALIEPGSGSLAYNVAGTLETMALANTITERFQYDDVFRLTQIDVSDATTSLWNSGAYVYDGAGNIKTIGSQEFYYDVSGRLVDAAVTRQIPPPNEPADPTMYDVSYTFDAMGNMTERTWSARDYPDPQNPPAEPQGFSFSGYRFYENQNRQPGECSNVGGADCLVETIRSDCPPGTCSAAGGESCQKDSDCCGDCENAPTCSFVCANETSRSCSSKYDCDPVYCSDLVTQCWTNDDCPQGEICSGADCEERCDSDRDVDCGSCPDPGTCTVYPASDCWSDSECNCGPCAGEPTCDMPTEPHPYRYDPNGNLVRLLGSQGTAVAAAWDSLGRMRAFYVGNPEDGSAPAETYVYNAAGLRIVRNRIASGGRPVISIRDASGQTVAEYVPDPVSSDPELTRAFVYGPNGVLVERHVTEVPPTLYSELPILQAGEFRFRVDDPSSASSYSVDIRSSSGSTNLITGIVPDGSGIFTISESEFSTDETNFVRIRRDGPDVEPYSRAVSIVLDSTVDLSSENQVRAVSVTRFDGQIAIRWALLQANGKLLNLYFDRADGGGLLPVSLGMSSEIVQYVLLDQALASPCGSFGLTQSGGGGETGMNAGSEMPPADHLNVGDPGCETGSTPDPTTYTFADSFQLRDHLGSLRLRTDETGRMLSGHDYYAFGKELVPDSESTSGGSRRRFTGHERDEVSQADYMMARYKLANQSCFLTPDKRYDVSLVSPWSWNKAPYVRGNPVNAVDPRGMEMVRLECPEGCGPGEEGGRECPAGCKETGYYWAERETVEERAPRIPEEYWGRDFIEPEGNMEEDLMERPFRWVLVKEKTFIPTSFKEVWILMVQLGGPPACECWWDPVPCGEWGVYPADGPTDRSAFVLTFTRKMSNNAIDQNACNCLHYPPPNPRGSDPCGYLR